MRIMKIDEMASDVKTMLKDIMLGNVDYGKYQVTYEGLVALYKSTCADETDMYEDFLSSLLLYSSHNIDVNANAVHNIATEFVMNRMFDRVSWMRILDAVECNEFSNYIHPASTMFVHFKNGQYKEWMEEVESILRNRDSKK